MKKYNHQINIKLTQLEYDKILEIKKLSGKPISKLVRENLPFLLNYYSFNNKLNNLWTSKKNENLEYRQAKTEQ